MLSRRIRGTVAVLRGQAAGPRGRVAVFLEKIAVPCGYFACLNGALADLRDALARAEKEERDALDARLRAIRLTALSASEEADDTLGSITLTTVAGPRLAGQVATDRGAVRYASLCLAA